MNTERQCKLMDLLVAAEELQAAMPFRGILRLAFQHLGSGFPDLKHVSCVVETDTNRWFLCWFLGNWKGTWTSRRDVPWAALSSPTGTAG